MAEVSKSKFKAHALEIMREIEETGESIVVTDRGRPTLEIKKLRQRVQSPRERLKGTLVRYDSPTEPVGDDDWELG